MEVVPKLICQCLEEWEDMSNETGDQMLTREIRKWNVVLKEEKFRRYFSPGKKKEKVL